MYGYPFSNLSSMIYFFIRHLALETGAQNKWNNGLIRHLCLDNYNRITYPATDAVPSAEERRT